MKRIVLILLALLLAGQMVFAAPGRQGGSADELGDYPNKPITCIVPYGPGGGTDVFVRTLLKYLNPTLRHLIAVVNIEGGGGLVGGMQG